MNIFDLARSQAAEIDRLEGEVAKLRQASTSYCPPEPAAKRVWKGRNKTLAHRVAISAAWTKAKREAQSKKLVAYWAMERATRPAQLNGELHI